MVACNLGSVVASGRSLVIPARAQVVSFGCESDDGCESFVRGIAARITDPV